MRISKRKSASRSRKIDLAIDMKPLGISESGPSMEQIEHVSIMTHMQDGVDQSNSTAIWVDRLTITPSR